MYRLLKFLTRFQNAMLFLALEALAFYLIVVYNDHQRHVMGDFMFEVASEIQEGRDLVQGYFNLREDNEQWIQQNQAQQIELDIARKQILALKSELARQGLDTIRIKEVVESVPEDDNDFVYIPCRVIKNSIHKNYNYLTLDKGSEDGLATGMGVVSPQGVAGKIIRTSEHYSLALSALNVGFKLTLMAVSPEGVDIEGNVGIFDWTGGDPRYANLKYIPETVDLEADYAVVTSGHSTIFPPGYKVGHISSVGAKNADGYLEARIKIATDFNALRNVYVLKAKARAVLDSLEIDFPQE